MANVLAHLSSILIPAVIFFIIGYGWIHKCNLYDDFINGAADGLKTVVGIVPTLIGLMMAVGILRGSGLLDLPGKLLQKYAADSSISGMFWGDSNAMQQLRMLIEKVAKTDANILITGENGTGKEMLAREIHLLSPRKDEAMVPVDMGAITETLFESELFGHVKGAFTDARTDRPGKFEVANNGSLFLDEIGNLSYHLQAKLLTALQRRSIVRVGSNTPIPINIRLICATNRDLQEMVQKEQFREDLLYRINTIHVEIPPLRERPEDIVPLTEIFITKYTNIYGKKPMALTDDAKEKLKAQPWLGNIRELEHTVEKAIIIADGDTLDGSNFDFPRKREAPVKNDITTLEEMEYTMIKAAMDKFGGNLSLVANQLGISRQTLYNKIKRYEL